MKNIKIIFILLILISFISLSFIISPTHGEILTIVSYNSYSDTSGTSAPFLSVWIQGETPISELGAIGETFKPSQTGYLHDITVAISRWNNSNCESLSVTLRMYIYNLQSQSYSAMPDLNSLLATSTDVILTPLNTIQANGWSIVTFEFNSTVQLSSNTYYGFVIGAISVSGSDGTHNIVIKQSAGGSSAVDGYRFYYHSGETVNSNNGDLCYYITFSDTLYEPIPEPTPYLPEGTYQINWHIVGNGNLSWSIPNTEGEIFVENGQSNTYLENTMLRLRANTSLGNYFYNFTFIELIGDNTQIGYYNNPCIFSIPHFSYNVTVYFGTTPNNVNITLSDVTHGSIYFQNYFNSVPDGVRYGSGTYSLSIGTTIFIGTLPDSGYNTDYYTLYSNGVTSKVTGNNLTFVAVANTTITPHYYVVSSTDVTEGWGSITTFLGSFTWQNILVLIIYICVTGLCTYLFAFTGLIAGLDISTVICFITGLLGTLMYPVLGLVIVCNIALIALGSGLLNRKNNGKDA